MMVSGTAGCKPAVTGASHVGARERGDTRGKRVAVGASRAPDLASPIRATNSNLARMSAATYAFFRSADMLRSPERP
jgi:hypothetical protein